MLNTTFLDKLDVERNCPGFQLWDVVASDGNTYRMAGDHKSGVETRLFFATNGQVTIVDITLVGPNPDVEVWDSRVWNKRTRRFELPK